MDDISISGENPADDIKRIIEWGYYDNWQHGKYRDENKMGYGPIMIFNASIIIKALHNNDMIEEEKQCDLSPRRIKEIIKYSTLHHGAAWIFSESHNLLFFISGSKIIKKPDWYEVNE